MSPGLSRRRVVRVPASSANLGPGFDAMAAAISLHLQLEVELFDFGATPTVRAPSSSETFDATSAALSGLSAVGH